MITMLGECRLWGGVLVASWLSYGCSSPTTGALGNGHFQYVCSSSSWDAACTASSTFGGSAIDLPSVIAVGGTFQLGYAPLSDNGNTTVQGATGYEIIPGSPELAAASGENMLALRSGYVALIARHVGNDTVDDFVPGIKLSPIHALRADPASLTVAVGSSQTVQLTPTDMVGSTLAGQIACQWTVTSGASSISLMGSATNGSASVMALSGGNATVHAVCRGASADVDVTVTGGPALDGGTD